MSLDMLDAILISFSTKTPILIHIHNAQMIPACLHHLSLSFSKRRKAAFTIKPVAGLQKPRGVDHKSVQRTSYVEQY
jgi:hypothetical protein